MFDNVWDSVYSFYCNIIKLLVKKWNKISTDSLPYDLHSVLENLYALTQVVDCFILILKASCHLIF